MVDDVVEDNQYDPTEDPKQGETLPLDEVIRLAIEKQLYETHTWLPGKITNVKGNSLVDVQPFLQRRYANGDLVTLPVIQNVPVEHPRGATWSLKLPIANGDQGRIVFCERSLDLWKVSGGIVDPQDPRHHHYTDAIFVPGLYSNNQQLKGAATDMIFTNGLAQLFIKAAGTFKLTNGTKELLQVVDDFIDEVKQLTTQTTGINTQMTNLVSALDVPDNIDVLFIGGSPGAGGGQFGPAALAQFTAIMTQLATIAAQLGTISGNLSSTKSDLESLKG